MRGHWIAPTAFVIACASLLLNFFLLWQIAHPRRLIAPVVAELTAGLVDDQGVINYDIDIPIGTPLNLDIPVDERFSVAVDTVIPLNTTVRVPIRGPLGTAHVNVPIRANIPLQTSLPLHIEHIFRLRTQTTQSISVPIRIQVEDLMN